MGRFRLDRAEIEFKSSGRDPGLGAFSLVLGLAALVLFFSGLAWAYFLGFFAFLFGIFAVSMKSGPRTGLAGLILGALTIFSPWVSHLVTRLS